MAQVVHFHNLYNLHESDLCKEVKMLVTLVGQMMAPSIAFTTLAEHLTTKGVQTLSLIGAGKSTNLKNLDSLVENADVVLIGISGPKELAREELIAAEIATVQNIPYGFYSDTYDVFRAPLINRKLKSRAAFLFVPCEEEREEAKKIFPNAEIIASGNPTWEDFFSPKYSKKQVRDLLMIKRKEKAVLCSLGTVFEINMKILKALDAALTQIRNINIRSKVIVGIHPGDQNYRKDHLIYTKNFQAKVPMRFITRDEMPTMDIIPGADYVVDTPGSSIGINAACLRKPVICYCSEIALDNLEKSTTKKLWRPCKLGVMKPVNDPNGLAYEFHQDFGQMIKRQKEVYPKPAQKGRAIKIMTETLQRYGSFYQK